LNTNPSLQETPGLNSVPHAVKADGTPVQIQTMDLLLGKCRIALWVILAGLFLSTACSGPNSQQIDFKPRDAQGGLPVSMPEDQGLDSGRLAQAYAEAQRLPKLRSLLVVRNGYLVAEKYYGTDASRADNIFSATKSVMSALVGIALSEGYIDDLQQKVVEFLPEYFSPQPDVGKTDITIEHLLTMRSGLKPTRGWELHASSDALGLVLNSPQLADPGRVWNYSGGDTHLLSAILTRTTGMSTAAFAERYLFGPLGIKHYLWQKDQQGIHRGNAGLYLAPRDLAKFGLLYLNDGSYNGRQILAAGWPARSMALHVTFPFRSRLRGYGYLWWLYRSAGYEVNCAVGAGGQLVMVVPELSMVVVSTSAGGSVHEALRLLKIHILPAVRDVEAPISSFRKIAAVAICIESAILVWRMFGTRRRSATRREAVPGLAPADKLIVVALMVAALGVYILPVMEIGLSAFDTARLALGLTILLCVGYPFALAGHYELYVPRRRRSNRPLPRQEKIATAAILIIVLLYLIRIVVGQLEWLADVDYVFDLFDNYDIHAREQGGWRFQDAGWLAIVPPLVAVWAARLHWAWLTCFGKIALLGTLFATVFGLARSRRYLCGNTETAPRIPAWLLIVILAAVPVALSIAPTLLGSAFPVTNHYIDQRISLAADVFVPSVAGPVLVLATVSYLTGLVCRSERLRARSLPEKAAVIAPLALLLIVALWTGILWAQWNAIVLRRIYMRVFWFRVNLPAPEPWIIALGGIWTAGMVAAAVAAARSKPA
jgi:CubicO group peptidase (beta-lactamase class C family)